MRNFFLFICVSICPTLFAQVELLSSDLPEFGTVVTYRWCNFNMNDTSMQGSDVIWDFSSLVASGTVKTHTYMDPASTPYGLDFNDANYAMMFQTASVFWYHYYNKTDDLLDQVGVWNDWSQNFVTPVLVFPMTLGTSSTSIQSAYWSTSLTGVGTGTLLLPSGTYPNVVMVRRHDVYEPSYSTNYKWYDTESGVALLSVTASNDELAPYDFMLMTDIYTGMEESTVSAELRCVNPVSDMLELIYGQDLHGSADLVITDHIGRSLRTSSISIAPGQQRARLFVGDLPGGCYLLTLRPNDANSALRTVRFVKQ